MHIVGIFVWIHPAGLEIYSVVSLIHTIYLTHYSLAARDLALLCSGNSVEEIEVLPPIALRGPHDLLAVVQILAIALAVVVLAADERLIVDEGLACLLKQRARHAARRIHFNHPVELMAALVVLEGEAA